MTTKITEQSDAVLWAALRVQWLSEGSPGWVVTGNTHYEVLQEPDGDPAFLQYTQRELFDSRSFIGSKPASYTKLDNG